MSLLQLTSYGFIAVPLAIFLHYLITTLFSRYLRRLPPGPKPWPIVGNLPLLGAAPHHSLAALASKYGPLMHLRLGYVNVVVVASASMATEFLKTHDLNFSNRPLNSGGKHLAYNYQDMVFAPYGPRWRMLRKICSLHLFSAKALDTFSPIRQEEVSLFIKQLARAGSKAVKLGQDMHVCVTNALSRVMLGRRVFGSEAARSDLAAEEFKDMVVELMVLAGIFNISDYLPALERLDLQGVGAKMRKLHNKFDKFIGAILDEQKASLEKGHRGEDLLSTFLSLKDNCDGEGGKLSDTDIKALLLDFFTAGTDTSTSTTEWAVSELIRNPEILAKVQQEMDSVVGRDRLVTEADIPNLTYFQAVVKESFRLHPSTPLSLPRIAAENCEINGYHIPKNSTVLFHVWAIARDPAVWANPLEFKPERFLPGGERPNANIIGNDFEVMPFGAGRRKCVGMNLGLRVVHLLTATLAHAFNWKLASGARGEELNMEEDFGLALQRKDPLMLHPIPRLSAHVYE